VDCVSGVLPTLEDLSENLRNQYRYALDAILALYKKNGGVYYTGSANGSIARVSLRGVEEQHKELCELVAKIWEQILLSTTVQSTQMKSHLALVQHFNTWITDQGSKGRIFAGEGTKGLLSLMRSYISPGSSEAHVLPKRTIARTASGRLGVVPALARKDDLIVSLVNCKTLVIVRTTDKPGDTVAAALRKAFLEDNVSLCREGTEEVVWRLKPDSAIASFSLIGSSYLDEYVTWGDENDLYRLEMFAFC
jgi:hypothetical protein